MSIRVAIIGAGVSGLACATQLAAAGVSVHLFDKSHAPGGRCATRQWRQPPAGGGATAAGAVPPPAPPPTLASAAAAPVTRVDHGAPYFTCPSAPFRAALDGLAAAGRAELRTLPATAIVMGDGAVVPPPPHGRRFVVGGNRRLGEALAAAAADAGDVTVRYDTRIGDGAVASAAGGDGAAAASAGLPGGPYAAVVVTPPGPQAAALLGVPATEVAAYATTLTVVLAVAGSPPPRATGSVYQRRTPTHPTLTTSTCEAVKDGAADGAATTVYVGHAGGLPAAAPAAAAWADAHFDAPPDAWVPRLTAAVGEVWGLGRDPRVTAAFFHRWRYARAVPRRGGGGGGAACDDGPYRVPGRWGVYVTGDGVGGGGGGEGHGDPEWGEDAIDGAYMAGVGCARAVLADAAGLRGGGDAP